MKIGIVGAPSAGKSEFARALGTKLSMDEGEQVHIIDDYIKEAEDQYSLVLGFYATYVGNVACAMKRFEEERKHEGTDYLITCGTLIETMVYAAVDGVNMQRYAGHKDDHIKRSAILMQLLGLFVVDLMQYDRVFYLPLSDDAEDHWKEFDKNIPVLLEMWERDYDKLDGDQDSNVEAALGIIREAAVEATPTE